LNYGTYEEDAEAKLEFVFLDIFVRVFNYVWHLVNASEHVEHEVSSKEHEEAKQSEVSDDVCDDGVWTCDFVIISIDFDVW